MATEKKKTSRATTRTRKAAPSKKSVKTETKIGTKSETFLAPESIAKRAYLLWQKEGCRHGRDVSHWLEAESQLRRESSAAR